MRRTAKRSQLMTPPETVTRDSAPSPRHGEKHSIMRHAHRSSNTTGRTLRRGIGTLAALSIAAGSLCLLLAIGAAAATVNGVATIAVAADPSQALSSGGSTTEFTVTLPANAACSGDTATDGYHVYSYLVPEGTNLTTVKFVGSPSTGFGFVSNLGVYYGPANTAVTTGQIVSIPADFEWGPLVSIDKVPLSTLLYTSGSSGVWEAGIACANTNGALTDNWNTQITFAASASDANGFTWTAASGTVGTSPTSTTTTTTTTSPTGGGGAGGTASTTASSSTTTTTTTSAGSATTTSTDATGGATGGGASSDGPGTDSAAPTLAYTGFPVLKFVGLGLLGVGLGLILLGWDYRARPARIGRSQR